MALHVYAIWKFLTPKPKPPSMSGTLAAFAVGERVFRENGLNPALVQAVKRSIVNDRRRQARQPRALAGN
jgi:hypothetical protein